MPLGLDRRSLLKTVSVAATAELSAPWLSRVADAKTLRFIPQADLAPIWNMQYVIRNGVLLIWDMLFGVDEMNSSHRSTV